MKIQTLGWLIGFTALASSASVLACSQAEVVCQVGHAGAVGFAAKYYPVGTPGAACGIKGDTVGFESYHPKGGGDDGAQPDFAVPSLIAIQTDTMGNMISAKADVGSVDSDGTHVENADGTTTLAKHPAYALGAFSAVAPDADGFCLMDKPAPAVQDFPKVDAVQPDPMDPMDPGSPEVPAESVKQEWSNVKVYVTAAAQGTQFSGHLKQTDDTCSAEYDVAGLWPSTDCSKRDEDGELILDADMKPQATPSKCCPSADPFGPDKRVTGSGINPDFPVKCEQVLSDGTFTCVLDITDASKVPALNPGWDANVAICKPTEQAQ